MSVGYTGGRRSAAGGGGGGGRGGRRGAGGDGARRRHAGRPAGGGSPVRRMRRVGAWGPRRFVGDKRHTHPTLKPTPNLCTPLTLRASSTLFFFFNRTARLRWRLASCAGGGAGVCGAAAGARATGNASEAE
eukprot:1193575-Prorocentrum_minimum.AAC.2